MTWLGVPTNMRRRRQEWSAARLLRTIALLSVFVALLSDVSVMGQTTTGSLVGKVTDSQGLAIVGAEVELVNEGTRASTTVRTGGEGDYVFTNVPPGFYQIGVKAPQFQSQRIEHLKLEVLQTIRRDVSLKVGATAEYIVVTAETPIIQTETPTISSVVDGKQIEETPLNGRGDAYQLMGLAPGVQRPNSNALISGSSFAGGTTMTIDGITSNDLFNQRMAGTPPSLESVAEFTVIGNNATAEFGRGGAQVVMQTKSGTNTFHGSLFEFNRNKATQARNFFLAAAAKNPPFNRNEFGGSFGGPIRKDKLFFFASIEDLRQVTSAIRISAMPPTAFLSGDFSAYPGNVVNDPTTGLPFPGNKISDSRISAISKKFLRFYDAPNISTANGLGNNFTTVVPSFEKDFRASARGDYMPTTADRIMARWYVNNHGPWANGSGATNNFGSFAGTGTRSWNIATNWSHVFSPSVVNELLGGFNQEQDPRLDQNHDIDASSLVPGIPSQPTGFGSIPTVSISSLTTISSAGTNTKNVHYIWQVNDNLSITRGTHTLKMGGQFLRQDTGQGGITVSTFSFDGRYTRKNTGAVNAVNAFADFLLGYMTGSSSPTAGVNEPRTVGNSLGFYVMDNWQARKNLTLTLGLRWDKSFPLQRSLGGVSNFYPDLDNGKGALVVIKGTPNTLLSSLFPTVSGSSVGIDMDNYTHTQNLNFSPRVGFAYRPFGNPHLVFRGGFSLIYDYLRAYINGLTQVPFFATNTYTALAGATPTLSFADPFPTTTLVKAFPGLSAVPRGLQTPYQQQWNLTAEYEFMRGTALRVSYLGNLGTHLVIPLNLNDTGQVVVPSGHALQEFRPYPTWAGISLECYCTSTNTNQLQVGVRRRFSGLTFDLEYQWTKALGLDGANSGALTDKNNARYDYGNLDFYRRHYLTFSYIYDLPFGKGKLSAGRAVNAIARGWRVSGVFLAQSGEPLSVNFSPNLTGWVGNKASTVPGVDPYANQTIAKWFNLAAFTTPAPYTFGTSARNSVFGPSYWNLDAALLREISLTEKVKLNIRAESFNVLNHTSFAAPARNVSTPGTFGQITGTANAARQLSFSARLKF